MALKISLQARHRLHSRSTSRSKSSRLKISSKPRIRNLKMSKLKTATKRDRKTEGAVEAEEVVTAVEVVGEEAEAVAKTVSRTTIKITTKRQRLLKNAMGSLPNRDKVIDVIKAEVVAGEEAVDKIKLRSKIRNKRQRLKRTERQTETLLSRDKEVETIEVGVEVAAEAEEKEATISRTMMSRKLLLSPINKPKIRKRAKPSKIKLHRTPIQQRAKSKNLLLC